MAADRYKPGEPFFTDEQLAILKKEGQILQRPPKHLFFKEGESTNFVLVPLKGHLKVTKGAPERLIGIRKGPEPVGESSARYGSPRSANVWSIGDVEVLHLSATQWNDFVDENPRTLDALIYMLTSRLGEADIRLTHSELAAEPRLALALQELIESGLGDEIATGLLLELDHEELAQVSGLSVESVKKIMKIFRDGNLVRTGRRRVIIQDVPFLRRIAAGDRTASARRDTAE